MMLPPYPAARAVAPELHRHFTEAAEAAQAELGFVPDEKTIEHLINATFWASLRPEEGVPPRISLAFLPPGSAGSAITFARPLELEPSMLSRVGPAVERPGIHLGVWPLSGALVVWGTTSRIPEAAFVIEVIEPGHLVIKRRRSEESGKYANVLVMQGDQVKFVDESGGAVAERRALSVSLLGLDSPRAWGDGVNIVVQLATSMRAHHRGGSLLIVPDGTDAWRGSVLQPIAYEIVPPYSELALLARQAAEEKERPAWRELERKVVDTIAGLTAVDGATIITDQYSLLAFGAKIRRDRASEPVQEVMLSEPVLGSSPVVMNVADVGGTRHLSAAQFVQDQKDALALVASQDGRFTAFVWSHSEAMVRAYRVESLLL